MACAGKGKGDKNMIGGKEMMGDKAGPRGQRKMDGKKRMMEGKKKRGK